MSLASSRLCVISWQVYAPMKPPHTVDGQRKAGRRETILPCRYITYGTDIPFASCSRRCGNRSYLCEQRPNGLSSKLTMQGLVTFLLRAHFRRLLLVPLSPRASLLWSFVITIYTWLLLVLLTYLLASKTSCISPDALIG